jgi:hypothetical protein
MTDMNFQRLEALKRLLQCCDEIRQPGAASNVYASQRLHGAAKEVREMFGLDAIFDPKANIKAIAIRYDRGSETWQLLAVGTEAECKASCDRQRRKGCEDEMRVYQADLM